jgi:hypothetical protein
MDDWDEGNIPRAAVRREPEEARRDSEVEFETMARDVDGFQHRQAQQKSQYL